MSQSADRAAVSLDPASRKQDLLSALRRRMARTARSRIALAIFLALTAVAVVAEPFGTQGAMGPGVRVLYWGIIVGVSVFAGAACDEIALYLTEAANSWRVPLMAAGMMSLAYAPFVLLVKRGFAFFGAPLQGYPPSILFYSTVVSFTVYGVIHVLRPSFRPAEETAPEAPDAPVLARLTRRLSHPDAIIYRVSASDHMTEVATAAGIERIRLRFTDAIDEMDPVPGTCVHRSHWVVLSAVTGVERREGKLFVQLVNGEDLPVSRTYRPRLEEARPDLF